MTKSEEQRIEELITRKLEKSTVMTKMDEMEWLHYKRVQAEKRVKASKKRLTNLYNELRKKDKPQSPWGQALYWAERGLTIAKGAEIGYRIGDAINIIMSIRKLMKKNK